MERCGGLGSSGEEQGAVGKDREQWGGTGCSGEGQREVGRDRERFPPSVLVTFSVTERTLRVYSLGALHSVLGLAFG